MISASRSARPRAYDFTRASISAANQNSCAASGAATSRIVPQAMMISGVMSPPAPAASASIRRAIASVSLIISRAASGQPVSGFIAVPAPFPRLRHGGPIWRACVLVVPVSRKVTT